MVWPTWGLQKDLETQLPLYLPVSHIMRKVWVLILVPSGLEKISFFSSTIVKMSFLQSKRAAELMFDWNNITSYKKILHFLGKQPSTMWLNLSHVLKWPFNSIHISFPLSLSQTHTHAHFLSPLWRAVWSQLLASYFCNRVSLWERCC